jgi:N-acetylneuraminic acid mutarotase
MTLDETYAQGSNPSASSDYGSYTVTVGALTVISGVEMRSLSLSGETPYSVPYWTHIGSEGDKILGSRNGVTIQTLFDFSGTPWSDGGWFLNWGANGEVDASLGLMHNEFVDAPAWAAGTSTSSGGCQYYAEVDAMDGNGTGVVCAGDDQWNIRKTEYAKEGVGMLGSSSRISYASNGGGFYSSHIKTVEVGLTDTSLVGDDGWLPNTQVWSEGNEMQTPRMNFGAAAWNGKLFVFGGSTSNSYAATSSVESYDPATDSWTNRTPLPNALYDCTAATLNGSIYVYGTMAGGSVFFGRYNPANDSWLPIAGAPEMARAHAVVHTELQMLLFATDASGGSTLVSTVFYSPTDNQWMIFSTPACSSNAPRQSTFGFAGDGEQMYVVGGFRVDMFDVWNPHDETTRARRLTGVGSCWEWIPSLSVKRQGLACAMVGDDLFAIGGRNGSIKKTTVEVISTNGGTAWGELPGLMSPRCDHCAVTLDGKIYVLGGRDDDGLTTKTNFILDPAAL